MTLSVQAQTNQPALIPLGYNFILYQKYWSITKKQKVSFI